METYACEKCEGRVQSIHHQSRRYEEMSNACVKCIPVLRQVYLHQAHVVFLAVFLSKPMQRLINTKQQTTSVDYGQIHTSKYNSADMNAMQNKPS